MRKLLLLLLAALPLWSQAPTITQLNCNDVRDRSVRLTWVTDNTSGDAARVSYGTVNASLNLRSPTYSTTSSNSGRRNMQIHGLTPATEYFINDFSSNDAKDTWADLVSSGVTCTNCGSSDWSIFADNSGCDVADGEHPSFTTLAEDLTATPDAPSTSAVTTPPTVTGNTYTADGTCSDFATQWAAAKTNADTGVVSELVLPAGVPCHTTKLTLAAITNGGKVYAHSDADPKLLPPPGAMTDKTFKPHMAWIVPATMGQWGEAGGLNLGLIGVANGARGYYFENVYVGPPELDDSILDPLTKNITATDVSANTLTLDSVAGLVAGDVVWVNLGGSGTFRGHGVMQVASISGLTVKLYTGMNSRDVLGTVVDLTGANCSSSCGTLRRFIALPIAAHTTANSHHALTITGHGLENYPQVSISSTTSNTVTVSGTAGDYQLGIQSQSSTNTTILISGTSGASNCNGVWNSTWSGNVGTISRTGETPDCSGASGGTVQRLRAASVFRTTSDELGDYEPRSLNWRVEDANTIEILDQSPVVGVTGGWFFLDVEQFGTLLDLRAPGGGESNGASDITFDRTILGACLPWRYGIEGIRAADSSDIAIINSHIETCDYYRKNPVNAISEYIHGQFQSHVTLAPEGSDGLFWENNYCFHCQVIDNDDNTGTVEGDFKVRDFTFNKTYVWWPDWIDSNTSFAANRLHHFHSSFAVEHKSAGERISHSGNYFKGVHSDFQPASSTISFSLQGVNSAFCSGPSHVTMENNIFDRSVTAFQAGTSDSGPNKQLCLTEKFRAYNWLVVGTDQPTYDPGSTGGYLFAFFFNGFSDFIADRITYMPQRGEVLRALSLEGQVSSQFKLSNSILLGSAGGNENRFGVFQSRPGSPLPANSEDGGALGFAEYFDGYSAFDTVYGIPGIRQSTSGTYAVKIASYSASDAYCPNSIKDLDKWDGLDGAGLTWIGDATACPSTMVDSVADRLNATFQPGSWRCVSPAYDGVCADIDELNDGLGVPGPVTVTADDAQFTLAYHAPSTTGCYAQRALWDTDWATTWGAANLANISNWTQDASASQTQSINLASLTAETQYAWRLYCRKGEIGLVTTAGSAGGGGGPAIPTEGLVAHYAITEGSGDVIGDDSGNANHAVNGSAAGADANDMTWATDGGETVLSANGEFDNFFTTPADTTTDFTILITLHPEIVGSGDMVISSDAAATAGKQMAYKKDTGSANYKYHYWGGSSSRRGPVTIEPGGWHVAWVKQSGSTVYLGVDKETPTSYSFTTGSVTNYLFGGTGSSGWQSMIADVAVYNTALDQAVIEQYVDYVDAAKPGLGILP